MGKDYQYGLTSEKKLDLDKVYTQRELSDIALKKDSSKFDEAAEKSDKVQQLKEDLINEGLKRR